MKKHLIQTTGITVLFSVIMLGCICKQPENELDSFIKSRSLKMTSFSLDGEDATFYLKKPGDTNIYYLCTINFHDKEKEEQEYQESRREELEEEENINNDVDRRLKVLCDYGWIFDCSPLKSELIKKYLPDYQFLSVSTVNHIHHKSFRRQPFVFGDDINPFVLANPPTIAKFISEQINSVKDLNQACELIQTFADLQVYVLCKEMPDQVKYWDEAKKPEWLSRWKYTETEINNGWNFHLVFLTDKLISSYTYYEIEILRDGTITLKDRVFMGSSGGYM